MNIYDTREGARLIMNRERKGHWNRWGPFVSERAWGTVREDYSANGDAWGYFPHDHARSRAYRWNEDGINTNFALEFGQGWDPGGTIRAGIKTDLAMMSSGKIDWPKLIADGERLGIAVVQEEQNFRVQSLRG